MCGLVGLAGKNIPVSMESAVEDGLFLASLRGRDAVGIGIVPADPKNPPYFVKRLGCPPMYVKFPKEGANAVIGHVRAGTIGANKQELAHPFQFDNILGVHNGTLRGPWRYELQKETNETFGSDSEAIFFNFAYRGVEETIKSIYGAWCLVWWDDTAETLNFLRNDERPLWTARGKDGNLYWASEKWMIEGMLRQGEKDRDKLVRTSTEDGKEERFFHKLPKNTWRRWGFDKEGELIQLADIPLEGAEEPAPYTFGETADQEDFGKRWAIYSDGAWKPAEPSTPGALKISPKYTPAGAGKFYRYVAGVPYVSVAGGDPVEIPFRELVEFKSDGACIECGSYIDVPEHIGYLAKDYSWMACTDCVKDWMILDDTAFDDDDRPMTDGEWAALMDKDPDSEKAIEAAVEAWEKDRRQAEARKKKTPTKKKQQRRTKKTKPIVNELGPKGVPDDKLDDDLPVELKDSLPPKIVIPRSRHRPNEGMWNWFSK